MTVTATMISTPPPPTTTTTTTTIIIIIIITNSYTTSNTAAFLTGDFSLCSANCATRVQQSTQLYTLYVIVNI
jgi:hypothetical protein